MRKWKLLNKTDWQQYITGKYPILRLDDDSDLMVRGIPKIKKGTSTVTVDVPWYSVRDLIVGYTMVYSTIKLIYTLLKKNKRG